MDSNVKQDVELAKKSCEKAHEIIKSKRCAALALLASIGICLTLVVLTFVTGSLFGYYLANLQMLPIEQNVTTVKESNIETNFTTGEMHKLAQQLEHKIEDNQTTTISTTTQISTTTSTTSTDEDLPYFKISFDIEENEDNPNKDTKNDQMVEKIWNDIFETLETMETLEQLKPDNAQPISTTTTNPKDLTQTEFDKESIVLKPVFKATETVEPEEWDYENADDEGKDDAIQEPVTLEPTTQEPIFSETTTHEPAIPLALMNPISESRRFFIERYFHLLNNITLCPYILAQKCSGPAQQKVFEAQREEIVSILFSDFPANESNQEYKARIQNWTHQLDATLDRIVSTRVDLCAGHDDDDYVECQSYVKRNANCYFTNGYFCKTQVEWNIIGYTPIMSMADKDLC